MAERDAAMPQVSYGGEGRPLVGSCDARSKTFVRTGLADAPPAGAAPGVTVVDSSGRSNSRGGAPPPNEYFNTHQGPASIRPRRGSGGDEAAEITIVTAETVGVAIVPPDDRRRGPTAPRAAREVVHRPQREGEREAESPPGFTKGGGITKKLEAAKTLAEDGNHVERPDGHPIDAPPPGMNC
jgi:hypothetical protein